MIKDDLPQNLSYKGGVKCRWLFGDTAGFIKKSNKRELIKDLFKSNIHDDIISRNDPIPGLVSFFFPVHSSFDEEPREDNFNMVLNELIK